ncbi:hypothetical protein GQR36_02945 [Enterococcus termitis]
MNSEKRRCIVILGTVLLCTTQLVPAITHAVELDKSSQLKTATRYSENIEEVTTDKRGHMSDQMITESEGIENQTTVETIGQENDIEDHLLESSEILADNKSEIEQADDSKESSSIQGLADSLGTLEQLIPNNPEAVADISENLGILPTDEVTQEQLDTITTLRASASGWEGFQYLTNLNELVIFTGISIQKKIFSICCL